jgi:hypothetical protein
MEKLFDGETNNSYENHQRRMVDVAGFIGRLFAPGRDRGDQGPENGTVVDARQLAGSRHYRALISLGNWRWRPTKARLKEVHVVYASPGTIAAMQGWTVPDGSVLVKEVFEATTER